jgi:SAM-dependent methyltransferase
LVFRLEHGKNDNWELGDECFVFYKVKSLIDDYLRFFASRQIECRRFLELGMWEGGSLAFWYELLRPQKIVGIDLRKWVESSYFKRYIAENKLRDTVKTYWEVNQADTQRVKAIVSAEFDGPLDLVVDDASHLYGPTLVSFQNLFPLTRPGGFYVIEDWAWEHWPVCFGSDLAKSDERGLTDLVSEIVQAAGTSNGFIKSITVYQGFAAIERGDAPAPNDFTLRDQIVRLERPVRRRGVVGRLARVIRKRL